MKHCLIQHAKRTTHRNKNMDESCNIPSQWYVARTKRNQEFSVRNKLVEWNVAHYLPTQIETRVLKYRTKRVEVPLLKNLIFIHTTKERAYELLNNYGLPVSYVFDPVSRGALIVPDCQMRDFMLVTSSDPDLLTIEVDSLEKGEKVEVINGKLAGVLGEFVSNANGDYVIIRLPHVLGISVKVKVQRGWLRKRG